MYLVELSSFQSSPPQLCPEGRTIDIDAILDVIRSAKEFVYVAVMDYFPSTLYTSTLRYDLSPCFLTVCLFI